MRLEARNIWAGYGRKTVLRGVNALVELGHVVGLAGPNGSGKSTLLRVLSGALPPSRGDVFAGADLLGLLSAQERARRIAFVPQSESTLFDFSVQDVVLMGRYAWTGSRRAAARQDFEACARAMAAADILHLASRPVTELSGGEHRRVLVARALAQSAPFLLMDEPTANLDLPHQEQMLALIRKSAASASIGVLVALHDLNLAAISCDRILLMSEGRILSKGAPQEVLTSENLTQAFGAPMRVTANPLSGEPFVACSLPSGHADAEPFSVHVICGGGSGSALLTSLVRAGFHVTCGVLNEGDSDLAAARALEIPCVPEAPFSKASEKSLREAARLAETARALVLAGMPAGRGNLANFELGERIQSSGVPVYLIHPSNEVWDFTDGAATVILERMKKNGAIQMSGSAELVAALLAGRACEDRETDSEWKRRPASNEAETVLSEPSQIRRQE